MLGSKRFLTNERKRLLMVVSMVIISGFVSSTAIFGQDSLRQVVYGKPKAEKKVPPTVKPPTKKVASPAPSKKEVAAKNNSVKKQAAAKNLVDVTFIGNQPDLDVYLNDKIIGTTGESFQLTKKLAPGEYRLMAKNKQEVVFGGTRVSINTAASSFKIFSEPPPKAEVKTVSQSPAAKPVKSAQEIALETADKVKSIFDRYQKPLTTDSITLEDWQFVFQAAQFGQLPGYTAVQIDAQRWFSSGQIELIKGENVNALTAFNKALEFMPGSALPFYGLGNTYLANQQLNDALRCYQKALQLDPKFSMAYKKLGDTQRLLKREKEAMSAYRTSIQLGYKTPETRYWLATLMMENKQVEEALKELQSVSLEMPKAEVFITMGIGYEKIKRDVSAIESYRKAIDLDPGLAIAYFKLATVYHDQRELTKAKEAYEKAIDLDPTGKSVNLADAQKRLKDVSTKINK